MERVTLLSSSQVAARLSCSSRHARRIMAKCGAVNVAGLLRVDSATLEAWLRTHTTSYVSAESIGTSTSETRASQVAAIVSRSRLRMRRRREAMRRPSSSR